jgi:hypothetical protein
MIRMYLAGVIAISAAAAQAQSPPEITIKPAVDTAEQRQAFRTFSECVAQSRPAWARRTLSHPYLSHAQARAAAESLSGKDSCLRNGQAELTFRTSSMVGSLAEYFLRAEPDLVGSARLTRVLHTLAPQNASEDFALCIVARNPAAARDLALSEPGSKAETQAAGQFAAYVRSCTNAGEQPSVDLQALRALTSVALYRGTTTGNGRQ